MIFVPQFKGGIGNQLFQLAWCYELADRHGGDVALDLTLPFHAGQGDHPLTYQDTLFRGIPHVMADRPAGRIEEGAAFPNLVDGAWIVDGYWQTPELWTDPLGILDRLRWFAPQRREALCVHVRGGDYRKLRHIYPEVEAVHYRRAIYDACRSSGPLEIHTDDPEYARELLPDFASCVCLGDFGEMASAASLVLSNSTWAWWAAALGEVPDVVMPPRWINAAHSFNP